ncbi:8637_t:CDS:2, partial [Gigaspora rosea]
FATGFYEVSHTERTYKMDIWDFIFSLNPDHAAIEFSKAFNSYLKNLA